MCFWKKILKLNFFNIQVSQEMCIGILTGSDISQIHELLTSEFLMSICRQGEGLGGRYGGFPKAGTFVLGTIDILGTMTLLWGAVLCIMGYLAASLTSPTRCQ